MNVSEAKNGRVNLVLSGDTGHVRLDALDSDPKHNPRGKLSDAHVNALVASMGAQGQLDPITVTLSANVPDADPESVYTTLSGFHRVEAARKLGWESIRAQLVQRKDVVKAIAEQVVRKNLSSYVLARECALMLRGFILGEDKLEPTHTEKSCAESFGLSTSHVRNLARAYIKVSPSVRAAWEGKPDYFSVRWLFMCAGLPHDVQDKELESYAGGEPSKEGREGSGRDGRRTEKDATQKPRRIRPTSEVVGAIQWFEENPPTTPRDKAYLECLEWVTGRRKRLLK